jgi:DNA polymerase
MMLHYADINSYDEDGYFYGRNRKIWGGTLLENIIQALARIVITDQMLEIDKLDGVRVVGCTHDEVIAICHKDIAEERFNDCIRLMSVPPIWAPDVPLSAEGGWAANYSK